MRPSPLPRTSQHPPAVGREARQGYYPPPAMVPQTHRHWPLSPPFPLPPNRMISGLSLDDSLSSLCLAYLATVQALAYGTRLILEGLEEVGHCPITSLFMCGEWGLGGRRRRRRSLLQGWSACTSPLLTIAADGSDSASQPHPHQSVGGLSKNDLLVREHADATGCALHLPRVRGHPPCHAMGRSCAIVGGRLQR